MSTTNPQPENGTDQHHDHPDAAEEPCLCATTTLGCFEHFQGGARL